MAENKHKIFDIKLTSDEKQSVYAIEERVMSVINDFLGNRNLEYISHSVNDHIYEDDHQVIVNLVYKDLNDNFTER